MNTPDTFLDQAYAHGTPDETREFYRQWAETYDEELRANRYASPERTARAMAATVDDPGAPLLDLGCGTGLSGEAFRDAGFTTIDGTDFTQEMLNAAETKNIYRKLFMGDLNTPVPAKPGEYANIAAVGVLSPGHAPPPLIAMAVDLLPKGGCFGFSMNDHAMEDEAYPRQVRDLVDHGTAEIAFEEYGDHLPGIDLKAMIYVLRKL